MVYLGILIAVLISIPAWIIWTKWLKHLWIKIVYTVLASLIAICFIGVLVEYNNMQDSNDRLTEIGGRLRGIVNTEINCIANSKGTSQFIDCVDKFGHQASILDNTYPGLDLFSK